MITKHRTTIVRAARLGVVLVLAGLAACSSKPPAEVSSGELAGVRKSYASLEHGAPKKDVLGSFRAGNKVKLGSSVVDNSTIEEWKVEAFHDESKRKDLFVTFLYFVDDKYVDSSDTRIDFRNNHDLVERWRSALAK